MLNIEYNELRRIPRNIMKLGLVIEYALIKQLVVTMIVRMRETRSKIGMDEVDMDGDTAKRSYEYAKLAYEKTLPPWPQW